MVLLFAKAAADVRVSHTSPATAELEFFPVTLGCRFLPQEHYILPEGVGMRFFPGVWCASTLSLPPNGARLCLSLSVSLYVSAWLCGRVCLCAVTVTI